MSSISVKNHAAAGVDLTKCAWLTLEHEQRVAAAGLSPGRAGIELSLQARDQIIGLPAVTGGEADVSNGVERGGDAAVSIAEGRGTGSCELCSRSDCEP